MADIERRRRAPVGLRELVAVDRVVEEVGEVGEQLELPVRHVGVDFGRPFLAALPPRAREAVAVRPAAVGRVDQVEAAELTGVHGAPRDLVGRVPACRIPHAGEVPAVRPVALRVAQHAVALAEVVGLVERAVVVQRLQRVQQPAGAERRRVGEQQPPVAVAPEAEVGDALRQHVGVGQFDRTGRREITLLGVVRPFLVAQPGGQLGDHEIEIGPALPVAVAALVDEHAVHRRPQVGAVVEVEAAQVELVRLALAAVLADDEPGCGFQQLAGAVDGARFELLLGHGADVGRVGNADLAGGRTGDGDPLQFLFAAGLGGW